MRREGNLISLSRAQHGPGEYESEGLRVRVLMRREREERASGRHAPGLSLSGIHAD